MNLFKIKVLFFEKIYFRCSFELNIYWNKTKLHLLVENQIFYKPVLV